MRFCSLLAQSDNVIEILDFEGNTVVKYVYDAWGNHTITDNTGCYLGTINPFRYRGYYYDVETGLYYLHSRYYDPVTGRFISMDDIDYLDPKTIGGTNLYAYCNNNPVMYVDPTGHFAIWAMVLIGTLVGAVFGFGFEAEKQLINNDWNFNKVNWGRAVDSGIVGSFGNIGTKGKFLASKEW